MGSICSCCSKRERSLEDLLDGSLEDKLLGKKEDDDEVTTTAEEEAWRQRREQLKDEEDMSMGDDESAGTLRNGSTDACHSPLVWDLSDRNTVRAVHKEVEEEEDEEAFGSAKEDDNDEDDNGDDQESKVHVAGGGDFRLTQLSTRSVDSYASMNDSYRGEDTRVFRDTELDTATEVSDSFLAPSSPSSLRGTENKSFIVDDDNTEQEQQEQQQKQEHDDQDSTEKPRSSSSRRRSGKKKSRSRKKSK